jgi:hypothetical protein
VRLEPLFCKIEVAEFASAEESANRAHSRLTWSEVDELLVLVRHKSILHNIISIKWCDHCRRNDASLEHKQLFQQLLDTLQVAFPRIDYPQRQCRLN